MNEPQTKTVNIAVELPADVDIVAGAATVFRSASSGWGAQWHYTGETQAPPAAIAQTLRWLADALELAGLETTDDAR